MSGTNLCEIAVSGTYLCEIAVSRTYLCELVVSGTYLWDACSAMKRRLGTLPEATKPLKGTPHGNHPNTPVQEANFHEISSVGARSWTLGSSH